MIAITDNRVCMHVTCQYSTIISNVLIKNVFVIGSNILFNRSVNQGLIGPEIQIFDTETMKKVSIAPLNQV